MIRRLIQVIATRRLVISVVLLLVLPVASAIVTTTVLIKPRWVEKVGMTFVGVTELGYVRMPKGVRLELTARWKGTPPPKEQTLNPITGLTIQRIVRRTGWADGDSLFFVSIGWWSLFLINVLPLLLAWFLARRWWQQRQITPGKCRICGYDLRATPDRCPECGAVSAEAGPAK